MARQDFDRYEIFRNTDNTIDQLPFVRIPQLPSDKSEEWIEGRSRLDKLAQRYYGNALGDWIILLANPEYRSEFDIPDGTVIRIPFPYRDALEAYTAELARIRDL
jgi:hypothetical protein